VGDPVIGYILAHEKYLQGLMLPSELGPLDTNLLVQRRGIGSFDTVPDFTSRIDSVHATCWANPDWRVFSWDLMRLPRHPALNGNYQKCESCLQMTIRAF
jgi:hypothetical protein